MDENTKPDFLTLLRDMVNDHLGRKDFTEAFAKVVETITELRTDNESEFNAIREVVAMLGKKLSEDNTTDLTTFKGEAKSVIDTALTSAIQTVETSLNAKIAEVDERVSKITDGRDADEELIVERVADRIKAPITNDIEKRLPELGASVIDAINLQPTEDDDDKIDASHIKGLDERIKEIAPKPNGTNFVISRGAVKMYDLSDQLDGVTKTFALPAFWRVINIQSSSSPSPMRETRDYSVDAAAMTVTFTAAVDAETTLAAGQDILVIYGES